MCPGWARSVFRPWVSSGSGVNDHFGGNSAPALEEAPGGGVGDSFERRDHLGVDDRHHIWYSPMMLLSPRNGRGWCSPRGSCTR